MSLKQRTNGHAQTYFPEINSKLILSLFNILHFRRFHECHQPVHCHLLAQAARRSIFQAPQQINYQRNLICLQARLHCQVKSVNIIVITNIDAILFIIINDTRVAHNYRKENTNFRIFLVLISEPTSSHR